MLSKCEVEFVTNARSALEAANERVFDLVLVGVDMNDQNALNVVSALQVLQPDLAVVCICAKRGYALLPATLRALRLAAETVGARGFVNFSDFDDDEIWPVLDALRTSPQPANDS